MNLDKAIIFDIEAKGFLDVIESFEDLHVLSCAYKTKNGWDILSTNKKEDIIKLVSNPNTTLVAHNVIAYDKPALEKMGIEFNAQVIDTLVLSYYLYSELDKHGLAEWGEYFGVSKPEIEDWEGLSYEEYKYRCEEDTKINTNLWVKMLKYLRVLYNNNDEDIVRVIKYLNHKAYMIHLQDRNPILIDIEKCKENLSFLEDIIKEKTEEIKLILPKVPKKYKKSKPAKLYKKDGSLSSHGETWVTLLKENNLPDDYEGEIEIIIGYSEPNPTSSAQTKDFLFSKGWKPKIFKDGANGKVPQLRDDDKNLCESIKVLFKDYPELEALEGLSVAQHRAGYLKGFLSSVDENGYAKAWAHAFTRTLRLKHVAPFVNLPKPGSTYGELVRGVMIAPEGYVCIGADLSSIEDKCKQISIYDYDPKYVESMNTKGWDAHLALGLMAGMFTEDEVQFYKWFKSKDKSEVFESCPESFLNIDQEEAFHILDKKRAVAKTSTYALTYGAGAPKVSESAEISLREAKKLHKGYWDMNWSVKKFSSDRIVKQVKGGNWLRLGKKVGGLSEVKETTWVWNEYSNMWLFLKSDKDRFSACNQNFGVKVFDIWGYILIQSGIKPIGQWHDEYLWYCKEDEVEKHVEIIKSSVITLNKMFKPPVPLEVDYKIGKNYAEVH